MALMELKKRTIDMRSVIAHRIEPTIIKCRIRLSLLLRREFPVMPRCGAALVPPREREIEGGSSLSPNCWFVAGAADYRRRRVFVRFR